MVRSLFIDTDVITSAHRNAALLEVEVTGIWHHVGGLVFPNVGRIIVLSFSGSGRPRRMDVWKDLEKLTSGLCVWDTCFKAQWKSNGDKAFPCLRPMWIWTVSDMLAYCILYFFVMHIVTAGFDKMVWSGGGSGGCLSYYLISWISAVCQYVIPVTHKSWSKNSLCKKNLYDCLLVQVWLPFVCADSVSYSVS